MIEPITQRRNRLREIATSDGMRFRTYIRHCHHAILSRLAVLVLASTRNSQRIARRSWSFLLLQSDNPFWQFSLAVYAAPGVAAECLALQKALDIDVNMLLFCAWLGARKTAMTAEDIEAFQAIVRPWRHSVVGPLRAARDAMKPMPEMAHDDVKALRKQILKVELRAEQIQQALLFQAITDRPLATTTDSRDEAVRANLRTFLESKARAREASLTGLSVDRLTHAAVTA